MWPFSSRTTLADSNLLEGITDYHSHILPGVDDGIRTVDEALETLKACAQWGIREIWLTPHVMEDYPNRTSALREGFHNLLSACEDLPEPLNITLHLGSENMLDPLFQNRLTQRDLLPIIDGKHLLVETSYYNPPFNFESLLTEIIDKGYIPVLAHPERYRYMNFSDYEALYSIGVKLQLNLFSVVGAYGTDARQKSCALLKKGMYFVVGSDLHRLPIFHNMTHIPVNNYLINRLKGIIKSTK